MNESTGLVYPLPWQMDAWQKLIDLHMAGKLPHALLLSGTDGSGVNRLALAFAQYVMCAKPSASGACGNCSSCGLTIASTHPDFKLLAPEKTGGQIKVDSVRSVVKFGHNTAQQGGYRVVVVAPAESMNTFSANSLLKSLEEPGEKTLFILISHMPAALLATIKSRCQWIKSSVVNQTGNTRARQGMQKLVEQILQRRRNLLVGNNPNVQLLLEALMLDLSKVLTIARG